MYGLRSKLANALINDATLTGIGFGPGRILNQHDKDTQPTTGPFIVIRMLGTTAAPFKNSPSNGRTVQLWFHDRPSDFETIELAMERAKTLMLGLENTQTTDGKWIQDVTWQADSEDFPDDDARTITRYCQWLITGSATT